MRIKNEMVEKIRQAMCSLGVKGDVTVEKYDSFSVRVFVNGKEFGIWDIAKETFVE